MSEMNGISLDPLFDQVEMEKAAERFQARLQDNASQFRHIPVPLLSQKLGEVMLEKLGGIDALQIFANGWAKLRELRDHADPKKHRQDRTTYVKLGEHKIETTFAPSATVSLAGFQSPKIQFDLTLTAELKAVELGIRMAHIRSVAGGEAKIKAKLEYADEELWKTDLKTFDLPAKHRFAMPGIPLQWNAAA